MERMKKASLEFFFSTTTEEPAIVGVGEASREAHPVHAMDMHYDLDTTMVFHQCDSQRNMKCSNHIA